MMRSLGNKVSGGSIIQTPSSYGIQASDRGRTEPPWQRQYAAAAASKPGHGKKHAGGHQGRQRAVLGVPVAQEPGA